MLRRHDAEGWRLSPRRASVLAAITAILWDSSAETPPWWPLGHGPRPNQMMNHDPLRRYLRRRDRRSFTRLVETERDVVLGVAMRVLGDRAHAEDATQDVFMSLLPPGGPDVIPERGRTWLVQRALQAARDRLRSDKRRRTREVESIERAGNAAPLEPEWTPAECTELREAVAELPDDLSACVELRYFGGLAASEIAGALGIARRTVDDRLVEARRRLRLRLAGAVGVGVAASLSPEWTAAPVQASGALCAKLEALAHTASFASAVGSAGTWGVGIGAALLTTAATLWVRGDHEAPIGASTTRAEFAADDDVALVHPLDGPDDRTDIQSRSNPTESNRDEATRAPDAGFTIKVVDETGALVKSGTLEIVIPRWAREPGPPPGPAAGPWRLGSRSLEDANPLVLPKLPPALEGKMVQARAFAAGYGSARPAFIDENTEQHQLVRLVLPAPRDLELTLVAEGTEDAVPNALVIARSELERLDADMSGLQTSVDDRFVVRTDSLGRCRLVGLGGGKATIEIHAIGFRSKDVDGLMPGMRRQIALTPDTGAGWIDVTVTRPDGNPLDSLTVHCEYMSLSGSHSLSTDAQGRARFEELTAGHYIARLDAFEFDALAAEHGWPPNAASLEKRVSIADGGQASIALGYVRGTATWQIELVDSAGSPVAGREVTLRKNVVHESVTDGAGRVVFSNLEAGAWFFSSGLSWDPGAHLLSEGQTLSTRMVIGDRKVSGQVKLDDGTPLARASLAFGDRYTASAMTDDQGEFTLEGAPPEEYYVHVHKYGYPGLTTKLVIEPGLDPPPLELVVPRGGTMQVELVGTKGKRWRVAAIADSGKRSWLQSVPSLDGTYKSGPLAPGVYSVAAAPKGGDEHRFEETVTVRAGATAEAVLDVPSSKGAK